MRAKRIAIVGATGAVGEAFLSLFDRLQTPVSSLRLLASERSAGAKVSFRGEQLAVEKLTAQSFRDIDIAFFSAGAQRSLEFARSAVAAGAVVIDNSSAFRMDKDVPLVVPEVNATALKDHQGIIANPNCSTIQLVAALNPIHRASKLKRITVATYQAVSGSGRAAIFELLGQVEAFSQNQQLVNSVYPAPILFNAIPQVDVFSETDTSKAEWGYTKEEMKLVNETRKIFAAPELRISATCVRVPVLRSHSEVVNIETERKLTVQEATELLRKQPGLQVLDLPKYPMPADCAETLDTYIGRIREDLSCDNGLVLWVVADQLFKGAALNAIQIAEALDT